MANHNPLWGTERIRGELFKLGIDVSSRSIRRYRRRRHSRPPSQSWRTFLANHAHSIWAADLFVVQTLTFQTLFVLFFISHGRRQLVHIEVTAWGSKSPSAARRPPPPHDWKPIGEHIAALISSISTRVLSQVTAACPVFP